MKLRTALRSLPLLLALGAAFHGLALAENAIPVFLPAASTEAAQLSITPDRADWTYPLGSGASFRVRIKREPYPAAGVPITYRLGPDMREGDKRQAVVPAEGLLLQVAPQTAPGFVRLLVSAELDGRTVNSAATAGFAPEKIAATQTMPPDFDVFWQQQKAALASIAPDWQLTPVPARSNTQVEVFNLSFQNIGAWNGPSRFFGVLMVPRGPGPFPAVLSLPGAGVRPYGGEYRLAARGAITLQVGIHGLPVDLAPEVYKLLDRGALAEYNRFRLDDRYGYYYRRVYLGALRASDYLASHPKWDGKHLITMGGSQGGQLSIMTAALDKRVTGVAANFPAYSDVTGYLHGTTGGWPGLFKPGADGQPGDQPVAPKAFTTQYYDTVNFARKLSVPGFYSWGYNDVVTPPTSTFAAWNAIIAPKQLLIAPDQGHSPSAAQSARVEEWVVQQLGLAK